MEQLGGFLGGFALGMIAMFFILISILIDKDNVVRSDRKITPDYELVVRGKTVDTIWVYKPTTK